MMTNQCNAVLAKVSFIIITYNMGWMFRYARCTSTIHTICVMPMFSAFNQVRMICLIVWKLLAIIRYNTDVLSVELSLFTSLGLMQRTICTTIRCTYLYTRTIGQMAVYV